RDAGAEPGEQRALVRLDGTRVLDHPSDLGPPALAARRARIPRVRTPPSVATVARRRQLSRMRGTIPAPASALAERNVPGPAASAAVLAEGDMPGPAAGTSAQVEGEAPGPSDARLLLRLGIGLAELGSGAVLSALRVLDEFAAAP